MALKMGQEVCNHWHFTRGPILAFKQDTRSTHWGYSFSYRRISSYFMMAFAPPKNTNGPKMQTKMSTWTPLNHQLLNDWAFEERRALLGKWVAV
uniref:Uncharacterized protein n=2 Tax=Ovis aries TaxID=9940 RepID=A0AC11E629_SHEEP